jgi:hypothetical protein
MMFDDTDDDGREEPLFEEVGEASEAADDNLRL